MSACLQFQLFELDKIPKLYIAIYENIVPQVFIGDFDLKDN